MRQAKQVSLKVNGAAQRRSAKKGRGGQTEMETRLRIRKFASRVYIADKSLSEDFIRSRQERGIDQYDEVWEGVYVVPPLANNPHQGLVGALGNILFNVVNPEERGAVFPGANVSDRRAGWEHSFRAPDVVVVLKDSRAVDCTTHWWGGPDFLIEIQSPNDDTDEKIPFYSRLQVRELLIIHRDTRELRLYRHDGDQLRAVEPSDYQGKKWLVSEVVPLAFRRLLKRSGARTEVRRTDDKPGTWTV